MYIASSSDVRGFAKELTLVTYETVKNSFGISSAKKENTKAPPYTVTITIYEEVLVLRACTFNYFLHTSKSIFLNSFTTRGIYFCELQNTYVSRVYPHISMK